MKQQTAKTKSKTKKNKVPIPADVMEQAKAKMQAKAKALGLKPADPVKVNGDLAKAEAEAEATAKVKAAQRVSELLNKTLIGGVNDLRSTKPAGAPKKAKTVTARKSTIKQLIIGMLTANGSATNDEMIAAVKKEFPTSAFDSRHAAWYRSQARTGKLTGTPIPPAVS